MYFLAWGRSALADETELSRAKSNYKFFVRIVVASWLGSRLKIIYTLSTKVNMTAIGKTISSYGL